MTSPEIRLFERVKASKKFNFSVVRQHNHSDVVDFLKQYFPTHGVNYEWVALMIKA